MGRVRDGLTRWLSLVVLLALLSSALPPAALAQPRPAPALPPPAILPPAPRTMPTASLRADPPDVGSTGLPASAIQELRQTYGARHTLGLVPFDGTFSSHLTSVYTMTGAITLSYSNQTGPASQIVTVPL